MHFAHGSFEDKANWGVDHVLDLRYPHAAGVLLGVFISLSNLLNNIVTNLSAIAEINGPHCWPSERQGCPFSEADFITASTAASRFEGSNPITAAIRSAAAVSVSIHAGNCFPNFA